MAKRSGGFARGDAPADARLRAIADQVRPRSHTHTHTLSLTHTHSLSFTTAWLLFHKQVSAHPTSSLFYSLFDHCLTLFDH